jgi:hypothetical protein
MKNMLATVVSLASGRQGTKASTTKSRLNPSPVGADYVTTRRLLDPDEALCRLETRLGPLHTQLRLGMEREHEVQAVGQGLSFLRLENLPLMQASIEIALRVTGNHANQSKERARAGAAYVRRHGGMGYHPHHLYDH